LIFSVFLVLGWRTGRDHKLCSRRHRCNTARGAFLLGPLSQAGIENMASDHRRAPAGAAALGV
jgi:hypothetical protein